MSRREEQPPEYAHTGSTQSEIARLREEIVALKMANGALRGFIRQLVAAIVDCDAPFTRAKALTERIP